MLTSPPVHRLRGKEDMHEVVSWAECGSAALTQSRQVLWCQIPSPFFLLEIPFILLSFIGESSLSSGLSSARGSQPVSPVK